MLSKFQRPEESNQYTRELQDYLLKMRESLNELAEERADSSDARKFIEALIKEQDENGFWGLIPSPDVDGDIRVIYWYTPTYIAAAFMMAFYMQFPDEILTIPGFLKTLKKGLEASTGRNLNGHGFDDIEGRLDALKIFAKGGVVKFIKTFPEVSPKFSDMIAIIADWLKKCLSSGKTKGAWGEDYKSEMEEVLSTLFLDEEIIVFVYGTLMKGKSNHNTFLSKSEYIGEAAVNGFDLYDLGSYPGVVYNKDGKVKGELYKIDSETLSRLDVLEGEGTIYKREITKAFLEDGKSYDSYIYVYNLSVSGRAKVGFENQPWGHRKETDYVWYASYGSNMLQERFLLYIKGGNCAFNGKDYSGCRDKSLPKDSLPIEIPYDMYYGNRSQSWGDGGVSFLDKSRPGKALGRMYLISKQQFEDIHDQECSSSNWYNEIVNLGEHEEIKIVTITNKIKRESCKPSDNYIDVVVKGIKETYPEMSSLDIMEYMVRCSKG